MKSFFVSDTFFGRRLTALERGFESEEHMLDAYIDNWNSKVNKNDTVYHLGNFSWDPVSGEGSMAHLQGKILFMQGLYDSHLPDMSLIKLNRHSIMKNQIAFAANNKFLISYWPLLEWPGMNDSVIHLHGGSVPNDVRENNFRFNVNIANWNGSPIESDFLLDMVNSYKS
jgi:calcineurin-like phosphoesterase family protein